MSRAVVLPQLARSRQSSRGQSEDEEVVFGRGPEEASIPPTERSDQGDDYFARLVKYIPGEALAFFLPFSASEDISDGWLIGVTAVGLTGACLWASNRNALLEPALRQPTGRVLAVTAVAFAAWALGTSANLQDLVGIGQQYAAIVTGAVALLLPAVDEALARRATNK